MGAFTVKIYHSLVRLMPFSVCVLYFEIKIPPRSPLGIQNWKKLFSAERIREYLRRETDFQLLCYIVTDSSSYQDKVALFSCEQMISSPSSSLLLLPFASTKHHLSSLCILTYWILIAALWSRLLLLSPFDRGKLETRWGYLSGRARIQIAQYCLSLIERVSVLKVWSRNPHGSQDPLGAAESTRSKLYV